METGSLCLIKMIEEADLVGVAMHEMLLAIDSKFNNWSHLQIINY